MEINLGVKNYSRCLFYTEGLFSLAMNGSSLPNTQKSSLLWIRHFSLCKRCGFGRHNAKKILPLEKSAKILFPPPYERNVSNIPSGGIPHCNHMTRPFQDGLLPCGAKPSFRRLIRLPKWYKKLQYYMLHQTLPSNNRRVVRKAVTYAALPP